MNSIKDSVA